MLHLIEGLPGSGKTYAVRNLAAGLAKEGKGPLLLVVPEQYSFETERAMLRLLGERDARKIEVTSFSRMADLVFRQTGGLAGRRLDDGGRGILMSLALQEVQDQLSLYRRQSESIEMVELMISALSEFKMCGVTPSLLAGTARSLEEGSLKQKAMETALILEAYDALVQASYLDPLDDLSRLANTLEEQPFFTGYTVFFDSFSGFTMQEFTVLRLILRQAREVFVALCTDNDIQQNCRKMGLFAPVYQTERELKRIAKEEGVPLAPLMYQAHSPRFLREELRFLSQAGFRRESLAWEEEPRDISLYHASNVYEETDFAARTIRRLVMEEGYRYRDFAVIVRNTETYQGILDHTLEKYEIPYFMDRLEAIDAKPLMNLVLTAFEVLHTGWSSEPMFRYLKTGLAGLCTEDISILENYILLWGISGKRWQMPFTAHPDGFSSEWTESDKKELQQINGLRERVVMPLQRFSSRIQEADGEGMARAVYFLLDEIGAASSLRVLAADLEREGEPDLAQEQLRLWDLLMELLDQTALVLKGRRLSSRRYAELLKLIIDSSNIAFIPQGLDEVTVGAADRSRPAQPRVVFLLGASEGDFPRTPVAAGVFSDAERRQLISLGLPMYDSLEGIAVEERFLAYAAMCAPSERLFVSWYGAGASGTAKTPSVIVRELHRLFPQIAVEDEYSTDPRGLIWARRPAFEAVAREWQRDSRLSATLKRYFSEQPQYQGKLLALDRAAQGRPAVFEQPEKARRLFGKTMRVSASQVEKYYLCRFQYFCRYGLRAKERKPAEFDALEYGSVMHYLLENILQKHSGAGVAQMQSAQRRQEIAALLERYVEEKLGGWEEKSTRFRFLFQRLAETADALIAHIARELSQSAFQPEDYELQISSGGDVPPLALQLPDGGSVLVEGKVDRVDVMHKNGRSYVRVIDYKTGGKEFRLSDLLYGLNMQMLLYLTAIQENGGQRYGQVVPAGVLYMPASRPVVDAGRDVPEDKLRKEADKKLRMNGLILDDPEVICGMEQEAAGVFIPVVLKDGKPAKLDSVASLAQMGSISKYIESLIVQMAATLQRGDVSPCPVTGDYNACEWCPYGPVCGHEEGSPAIQMVKWDRKAVLEALQKKEEE